MFVPIILYICFYLFELTSSSILTAPPLSALIVTFENVYDVSLLANTLSDQGIDTTLIIPSYAANKLYNNLIDVEVLQLNININKSAYSKEKLALEACDSLLMDQEIFKRVQELQPTFTIFPALRHDGCLLPWVRYIKSIPVIWVGSPEEEVYAFENTGFALPMFSDHFFMRFCKKLVESFSSHNPKINYHPYVLRLVTKYLPDVNADIKDDYPDVHLVLWGADTVLRSNFASLTQLLVEVGCHHCRGSHPLSKHVQKSLIKHRQGTIIVLLDDNYETLVTELAKKIPQGREGQAILWKTNKDGMNDAALPENLFIHGNIDRQDLIGYSRTRVVLSHCADTEFLEAAFHGTPLICLPRDKHESRNSERAVELGFADATDGYVTAEEMAKIVQKIHETSAYREYARKISLALRDRLNPASDRLIYWLRYVARIKDSGSEKFLRPSGNAWTADENRIKFSVFCIGIFISVLFGILVASIAAMLWQRWLPQRWLHHASVFGKYQDQKSKGRHTL